MVKLKTSILLLLTLLTVGVRAGINNAPDSVYIFTYATAKDHNHRGLHVAWSLTGDEWHGIGPEYAYLKSDFGRWGSQKRMLAPITHQDVEGQWHCFFRVNEEVSGVLAHAVSPDLVNWRPQAYHYPAHGQKAVQPADLVPCAKVARGDYEAVIDGEVQKGSLHRVPRSVLKTLEDARAMAEYKNNLHGELMRDDATRFANLKPVKATYTPLPERKKEISDMLMGIFFEDINYAADGGIYAELVQNRDFEYVPTDRGNDPAWNSKTAWKAEGATFEIATQDPIHPNNPHYAVLTTTGAGGSLSNEGFAGIAVKSGEKYRMSLMARALPGAAARMEVKLQTADGTVLAKASLPAPGKAWKRYEVTLKPTATAAHARLVISPQQAATLHLDMISLFPHNTFKNRPNGLRADLAQTLADLKPRFVRFPGGCVAHGDGLGNIYHWKNTIGPLESRTPQRNLWGYHQTAGLGYYEYFQFCEDIGAAPLPVVAAGVPCQNSGDGGHGQQCGIPMEKMDDYVQDVLDLIEWANGDAKKTVWGRKRAEQGHPKPFGLKYIGVGNEDLISDVFTERYKMICEAINKAYPEIVVIGTVGPFWEGSDYEEGWRLAAEMKLPMVDEHYYNSPAWYIHNQDFYDRYDRNKSAVYLGEYAAHVPGRHNNIETALAEALHLINIERNGDIVSLTSYAPLLAKEGYTQWNPDLIYFNNTEVKPTVGYQVQKLFGNNAGNEYISSRLKVETHNPAVSKRLATSLVKDAATGEYILKLVNLLPVEADVDLGLAALNIESQQAVVTTLSGNPDSKTAMPVESTLALSENTTLKLPRYALMVIRFK